MNETITFVWCNTCGQQNPVMCASSIWDGKPYTFCSKCGYENTLDNFVEHLKKVK